MVKNNVSIKNKTIFTCLSLLLVGLIVFFYLQSSSQSKVSSQNSPTQTPTQIPTPAPTITFKPPVVPTPTTPVIHRPKVVDGYIIIPEIGIKIPDVQITDLIYDVNEYRYTDDPQDLAISVQFSTQTIYDKEYRCGPNSGMMLGIFRTEKYPQNRENMRESKQLGKYFYTRTTPQALCSNDNSIIDLVGKTGNVLQKAYEKMEAIE